MSSEAKKQKKPKRTNFIAKGHFRFNKQLLDEVFVISRIIKVEVRIIIKQLLDSDFVISRIINVSASADNPYRDIDYSGYHKIRI